MVGGATPASGAILVRGDKGADSAACLWRWTAVRPFSADHREQRLRRRQVALGGGQAEGRLLEKGGKLRVGFLSQIGFCDFEHGFLRLFAPPPMGRVGEEKSVPHE